MEAKLASASDPLRTEAGGTERRVTRYERMSRFYLHVCNGDGFTEDEEGRELASVADARKMAIYGLRGIMAEELKIGELNMASFIEIEDEDHELIMTVPFAEAVNVSHKPGGGRR